MEIKDELSPNFIKQEGDSMNIGVSGSGIGEGLHFSFYDEHENDTGSVFIIDKKKIREIRDLLTSVLETDNPNWAKING
ncbi:hypothetical protein [Bacillus cereus]|uniref:hypothetical protein n=1 Tax=Bacillus cereus TaxID=1396 RepID=UPI003D0137F7